MLLMVNQLLQILKKQKLKPQLLSFLEEQLKVTKHAEISEKHEVNVKSKEQFEVIKHVEIKPTNEKLEQVVGIV